MTGGPRIVEGLDSSRDPAGPPLSILGVGLKRGRRKALDGVSARPVLLAVDRGFESRQTNL